MGITLLHATENPRTNRQTFVFGATPEQHPCKERGSYNISNTNNKSNNKNNNNNNKNNDRDDNQNKGQPSIIRIVRFRNKASPIGHSIETNHVYMVYWLVLTRDKFNDCVGSIVKSNEKYELAKAKTQSLINAQ